MSNVPPFEDPNPNPYASPSAAAWAPAPGTLDVATTKLIRDFRSQMLALGVLWTLFAVLVVGVLVVVLVFAGTPEMESRFPNETRVAILALLAALGMFWAVVGIGTLLKQMWAVWLGLVVSYLLALGNLLNFNLCGLVIVGIVILQAHRVLGFASQLQRKGIPLTHTLRKQTEFELPPKPFS